MKKYILLISILVAFVYNLYPQNFFPIRVGDEFQEMDYSHFYDNFGYSWTHINYPSFNIPDSLIYNNKVFYKYKDNYFAYDSSDQKLFIYINGESHLAADFTLPQNSSRVLYFTGEPRIWKSGGIDYQIVFGTIIRTFSMSADTVYEVGHNYHKEWAIRIAENIGPYYDYFYQWDSDLYIINTLIVKKNLVFAKIDTNEINFYNQSISLAEPVRDRYLSEFPYILPLNVTNPLTGLISDFYTEFNIFRSDTLISSKVFDIDTSTFLGFINMQPEELQAGDEIQFRCTLKDTSIFNNLRTTPDSGYYTFYVLPDSITDVRSDKGFGLAYKLFQNYPNPFNPVTSIQYTVGSKQFVTLKVYNMLGREVASLVNEEKPAGNYEVKFNASNLASGIYYCRIIAGSFIQTRKMILLK